MGSPNDLIYIQTVCPNVSGHILEIGARENTTGFRGYFQNQCASYTGTDIEAGQDVDVQCDLLDANNPLPKNYYDLVICCSVMEHVPNPWDLAKNIADLVKPGGQLYICVPWSWRYHPYPDDYYRFSFRAIEYLYPNFAWDRYAYTTENTGDFKWVEKNAISDRKMVYAVHDENGRKIKKYLSYLLINMIGTKNVA